jgi:hypothetical protein
MPVDGSYGRLGAHNQRLKDLKYKKHERKKNMNATARLAGTEDYKLRKHSPEEIAAVTKEIRQKARLKRRKDTIVYIILAVIAVISVFVLFYWWFTR